MTVPQTPQHALLTLLSVASFWNTPTQAAPRAAVVELYTSEGCSSCPPAEALLGELARKPLVLVLAFHVDYWDRLGWSDKYALPYAVQRQNRYAQTLDLPSIFTPQIVVDGETSLVGSDRIRVEAAIAKFRDGIPIAISRLGDKLTVELGRTRIASPADVMLVAYSATAVTAIGGGENAGRTLREFNIVRATYALGTWTGNARRFALPWSALPGDATTAAVLIQQTGQRAILGASTYALR